MNDLTLTDQQLAIVRFVESYRRAHFVGPSLRELADALAIGTTTASWHIHRLLQHGALRCEYLDSPRRNYLDSPHRIRNGTLHVPEDVLIRLAKVN